MLDLYIYDNYFVDILSCTVSRKTCRETELKYPTVSSSYILACIERANDAGSHSLTQHIRKCSRGTIFSSSPRVAQLRYSPTRQLRRQVRIIPDIGQKRILIECSSSHLLAGLNGPRARTAGPWLKSSLDQDKMSRPQGPRPSTRCGVLRLPESCESSFRALVEPSYPHRQVTSHLAARCQEMIPPSLCVLAPTVFYSGTILQFCNFCHITRAEPLLA